ncbi:MAG TPA: hypothetical protein DHV15_03765 [Treponema sp.]|uniref:Uncharacterized protein n=1 Tax=Treponema denticola (strain ATCC 35405 / DSM 14222 / CIP 103919 / JCM 8153 / KCTC 15104) TaxID=243275 RepID=Q73M63_TREDE|nr:hypothetical protein TDE_1646 [Treponema denticola ATCC 35405]HCY94617.1 hypothetical protein [Treponema sp.]
MTICNYEYNFYTLYKFNTIKFVFYAKIYSMVDGAALILYNHTL